VLFRSEKGASVEITLDGTGFILVGPYLVAGGKADVIIDGKAEGVIDVFPDEDEDRGGESVVHRFHLKPGSHTVKLVVRAEPYPGSKGVNIGVTDLVIFK
jgi:hypothetical protein